MTPQDTPPPLDADEAAERALVEAIRKIAYPERIFLQLDANEIEDTSEGPVMAGNITWCKDEINSDDVEYVRVDSLPGVDQGNGVREADEQAWIEIRDTMADTLLNEKQKRSFVLSILRGQLANPPAEAKQSKAPTKVRKMKRKVTP